jgi:hypothetical protein
MKLFINFLKKVVACVKVDYTFRISPQARGPGAFA